MPSRSPTLGASARPPATALIAALALACGGSGGDPTDPTNVSAGSLSFRASLIDPALIQLITPLGNINPGGHSLPTDHIYFQVADPTKGESPVARRTAFFAPGDGIITDVIPHPPSPTSSWSFA